MQSMVTQEAADPLEVDRALLGTLGLAGFDVPYVDLNEWPFIGTRLVVDDTAYTYNRSFIIAGHSAVMPGAVQELRAQGHSILVAERKGRYYVYVA